MHKKTLNPRDLVKWRPSQKVPAIVSEGQQCYWVTRCALLYLVLLSLSSFQQLEIIAEVIPPEPGIWSLFCRLIGLGFVLHHVSASHSNCYLWLALVDDSAITNVRRWDLSSRSLWKSGVTVVFTAKTISSQDHKKMFKSWIKSWSGGVFQKKLCEWMCKTPPGSFFFLSTVSFATSLKCTLRARGFSFIGYLSDERIVLFFCWWCFFFFFFNLMKWNVF